MLSKKSRLNHFATAIHFRINILAGRVLVRLFLCCHGNTDPADVLSGGLSLKFYKKFNCNIWRGNSDKKLTDFLHRVVTPMCIIVFCCKDFIIKFKNVILLWITFCLLTRKGLVGRTTLVSFWKHFHNTFKGNCCHVKYFKFVLIYFVILKHVFTYR